MEICVIIKQTVCTRRAFAHDSNGHGFKHRPFRFQGKPRASCSHAGASVIKQYNLVLAYERRRSLAGKVTAGLAGSNGSLPPGGWLKVTCRLTACTPESAPGPTLGNEYGRTLLFNTSELVMFQQLDGAYRWCNHLANAF